MHDQVGLNEFEKSDENKMIQKDDLNYSLVGDRSLSARERNTREGQGEQSNPENRTITQRSTILTRGIRHTFKGDVVIRKN